MNFIQIWYVNYSYDWDEGELIGANGPRTWQAEVFQELGEHLQNASTCSSSKQKFCHKCDNDTSILRAQS